MKLPFVWTLILLALTCYSEAATTSAPLHNNICDTCKCKPNAIPEKARYIECNCDSKTRTINTTEQNMQNLPHIESFTVINCDGVNFHPNSFAQSHDLSDVILKQVKTAVFPLGVFAKLDSLKIEDVQDLRLMENAFMGADIGEIAIRNTTMHEIPARALYDIKLHKLEFTDVNIGLVKSNSTLFVMGDQSNLIIDRCKVDEVQTGGLQLRAHKLIIRDSILTKLAPSSTVIDAAIGMEIISSTFGASDANGMMLTSKSINIFNNTFHNIPITLRQQGGKATITNNIINDLSSNTNVLAFINAEFLRNSFFCDCKLATTLQAVEQTAALLLPNFEEILQNNFCNSNCSAKLPAKDFFDKAKKDCVSGKEVELCSEEKHVEGDASTEVSGRSGRRDDHGEEHPSSVSSTTTMPAFTLLGSAQTSGLPKHGSSSLLTVTFLTILFLLA